MENNEFYHEKLRETARIVIESDIRSYHELGPDMVLHLLKDIEHAFITADGLEYPGDRKIPLWQFGLVR